jgi:sec-independent protein translocase protein TatC
VLLNLAGVVSARALARSRSWIILGVFVFAAAATPSTDPITMLFLAVPMTLLFLISEIIARVVDRRRARAGGAAALTGLADDQLSPLRLEPHPEDDRTSRLDD